MAHILYNSSTVGPQGSPGPAGNDGAQGATGTQGSQGVQGTTGQGAQGVQGTQGATGTQGANGTQGAVGAQGTVGFQGTTGSQGATGTQGAIGIQGIQGSTGAQGTTGLQGTTGTQGALGTQGSQGTSGSNGSTGAQGIQGTQGYTGTQGATGTQGYTGQNGAQGAAGAKGDTGFTGTQGTQGTQGVQGPVASAPLTLTQASNNANYPLTISSANEQAGGSGYSDIMKFINSKSGATNINKHIRLNSTGGLEIVNSAYASTILALTDAGNLSVPGTLSAGSYSVGETIKTTIWSNSDMSFTSNYNQNTTTYSTIASKTYTPVSSSSYIFVEVYARYDVNGGGGDTFFTQLTWNSSEFGYQHENWTNGAGGGSRSSKLFPLVGRITNASTTGYTLAINARRETSDDTLTVYPDSAFYVKITEIAR